MKKTVFTIITVLALISSCKQKEVVGPAGPAGSPGTNGTNGTNGTKGTDGKDGKDGNANVKSYNLTVVADWKPNSDSTKWTYSNNDIVIPYTTADSGSVLVYHAINSKYILLANTLLARERTSLPDYYSVTFTYQYGTNFLQIFAQRDDRKKMYNPNPEGSFSGGVRYREYFEANHKFRVVVIGN